jgi:hypothetical protein
MNWVSLSLINLGKEVPAMHEFAHAANWSNLDDSQRPGETYNKAGALV